jgi:hypothetical protein
LRPRTLILTVILAVLVGLLGFLLIRYAMTALSPEDERIPARSIPNTDVNPFGANFFLAREVEPWKRERTIEMAQQAGLGWAKQQFAWAEIEPLRKGEFVDPVSGQSSWAKFDQIVDLFRSQGMELIARLDRAPDWARPPDTRPLRPISRILATLSMPLSSTFRGACSTSKSGTSRTSIPNGASRRWIQQLTQKCSGLPTGVPKRQTPTSTSCQRPWPSRWANLTLSRESGARCPIWTI